VMDTRYRVLVAEDSETVRDILCFLLDDAGYDTVQACDGLEALQQALSDPPDLVLLDVDMPKMNGYQVCRVIKSDKSCSDVPVVMLTSRDRKLDRLWGMSTGADAYVIKALDDDDDPFGDLGGVLSKCLDGREPRKRSSETPELVPAGEILDRLNGLLDVQLFRQSLRRRVSSLANALQNIDETVRSIVEILEQAGDVAAGAIVLGREGSTPRSWVFGRTGISPDAIDTLRTTARREFEAAGFDMDFSHCEHSELTIDKAGTKAVQALDPMVLSARNRTIGVAVLATPSGVSIDSSVVDTLRLLLDNAALVLDNAQLFAGLEATNTELQRTLDELTSTQDRLAQSEKKVQQLEILIDSGRKDQKVAEIVDSEYFESLKARVKSLRRDRK